MPLGRGTPSVAHGFSRAFACECKAIARLKVCVVLLVAAAVTPAYGQSAVVAELRASLESVARIDGAPEVVSAGGITRDETRLLTIENRTPYRESADRRRLVLVGGLDGGPDSTRAVVEAVRWFKTEASEAARASWAVSALPLVDPGGSGSPYTFPPEDGYFDDPDRPESHYLWRWVNYQAPDLVVVVSAGDRLSVSEAGDVDGGTAAGALAAALASRTGDPALGPVRALTVTASAGDGPALMRQVIERAPPGISPLRQAIERRIDRAPLDVARLLAARYPGTPGMSYIPGAAWLHTLRLARITGEPAWRDKVLEQVGPWLSGEQPLTGNRISFAGLGGAMVFAELAREAGAEAAAALTRQAVELSAAETSPGIPEHGSGWTDDMFLGTVVASLSGDPDGLSAAVRIVTGYAERLQQPDGIFYHAPDAPVPWSRGNGFAALGMAELVTALPTAHPDRGAVLEIFRRQMDGLRSHQAADGMWFQVVDTAGSYREGSLTALAITAMARGLRLGWLDDSFRTVVAHAWSALLAHVELDGELVDVCISTGAGPTRRYYLDRPAVNGHDDRGGALILGAALEVHALGLE